MTPSLNTPLLDVRSPGEYCQGHIPGAINLPLFSDQERAKVGKLYKQVGQQTAFLHGLDIVGPKMRSLVENARQHAPDHNVQLYCWRGGLRSTSVAGLLEAAGFIVEVKNGGYKEYRRWAINQFARPRSLQVLGGATGSGKTEILEALSLRGEQILDLEALADHRGSSYGGLGQPKQPTQEQFENRLAHMLGRLDERRVWIEDENRLIGSCQIPNALFSQMLHAPLTVVKAPDSLRIKRLTRAYGAYSKQELILATKRISSRLGGERTRDAIHSIELGELEAAVKNIIIYYDKAYTRALERRAGPVYPLAEAASTPEQWALTLIDLL